MKYKRFAGAAVAAFCLTFTVGAIDLNGGANNGIGANNGRNANNIVAEDAQVVLALMEPGGVPQVYELKESVGGALQAADGTELPVKVTRTVTALSDSVADIVYDVAAVDRCWFSIAETEPLRGARHADCEFYMPGFWYHKNLRSPEGAPSFHTSDSWVVREDRLSTPLAGVYNPATGEGITVLRKVDDSADCIIQNLSGDVLLPSHTSIGFTGFYNDSGTPVLAFGYPYAEAPRRYIRKLSLIDPVRTYEKLEKDDRRRLEWQLRRTTTPDYSAFVTDTWKYSYDTMHPEPVETALSADEAKKYLANYFRCGYVDQYPLKYYSSGDMRVADCANRPHYQVGFIGRVLLNAFNAQEYGLRQNDADILGKAEAVLSSHLEHGFTPEGLLVQDANFETGWHTDVFNIRCQSEGAFALLSYLDAERRRGVKHPQWEMRVRKLLDKLITLQNPDGSFPRKFHADGEIVDKSGGATPSATVPLAMAYDYFKDKRYLECARRTAAYLERELIDKADYFSSTLDANCEDKEASLYASTAMYYLTYVTKGKEREHYMDLCRKAAYVALTWYYTWDVPFSPGQMLGEVGFKSRGWGNVSVENNHIDVYIFEFATVLDRLGEHYGERRFTDFAKVMQTSMLQLLPTKDNMYSMGRMGYYPEVVQHTTWDYGHNGKGFFNKIFAPGWTVASLWQMLSPERTDTFFAKR